MSEKFEASLQLGAALLKVIGIKETEISRVTHLFRDQDYALARESQGLREAEVGKNRMPWIAMKAPVVSLMKKKKL